MINEIKVGDTVRVSKGQLAGKTGMVVGIIVCGRDYSDPYYEVDMDCEVPDKYKCRKHTLITNNVIGGLSTDELEVIKVNAEPKEPTNKPNVGKITIPVKADLTDSYWDTYAADLAKEVVLKVANKYDPKEAAEYAVSVAKAVVEGLKRK